MTQRNVLKLIGLLVSGVGVAGQTWLLHHELNDSYPYKLMSSPPAEYYFRTAEIGLYVAPTVALAAGIIILLVLRREWTTWVLPVVVDPLTFAAIYLVRDSVWEGPVVRNFDGTTQQQVATNFLTYSFELSIIGTIVALTACFVSARLINQSFR